MLLRSGDTRKRTLSPLAEEAGCANAGCATAGCSTRVVGSTTSRPRKGNGLGHCPGRLVSASNDRSTTGVATSDTGCALIPGNGSFVSELLTDPAGVRFVETSRLACVPNDLVGYGDAGVLAGSTLTEELVRERLVLRLAKPVRSRSRGAVVPDRASKLLSERIRSGIRVSATGAVVAAVPTAFISASEAGRRSWLVGAEIAVRLVPRTSLADNAGNSWLFGRFGEASARRLGTGFADSIACRGPTACSPGRPGFVDAVG